MHSSCERLPHPVASSSHSPQVIRVADDDLLSIRGRRIIHKTSCAPVILGRYPIGRARKECLICLNIRAFASRAGPHPPAPLSQLKGEGGEEAVPWSGHPSKNLSKWICTTMRKRCHGLDTPPPELGEGPGVRAGGGQREGPLPAKALCIQAPTVSYFPALPV